MARYIFDTSLAIEVGVEKAVLLDNIMFWIKHNEANQSNYYDNRHWTYNSARAFSILFPFWSAKKIYNMLGWLVDNDYLIEGNYNKVAYDRTKWYAIGEKCILHYEKIHFTKSENGTSQIVKPIPTNKPTNNTDNKLYSSIPDFQQFKEYALSKKPKVDKEALRLKYESWVENDWQTGGDKPRKIKNWKATLINTLPYIKENTEMTEWEKLNKGWR